MDGSGLTPFALAFMLVSMGSVTLLMTWCFWRILSGDAGGGPAAHGPPVEDRSTDGGTG